MKVIDQHQKLHNLAKQVMKKEEILPSYELVIRIADKTEKTYAACVKGLAMMIEFGAVIEPIPGYFQLNEEQNDG